MYICIYKIEISVCPFVCMSNQISWDPLTDFRIGKEGQLHHFSQTFISKKFTSTFNPTYLPDCT